MAMIKSYTDIEQSRKLAEFLPIESADMKEERHQYYYNEGYNAGSAKGYEQAIEKACEWLDNELPKYIMEGREGRPYISVALVDDLKKAMKGD